MIIQLTDFEDNDPCLIQLEAIVYAITEKRQGGRKCTLISFGLDAYVRVRETPAEIMQYLVNLGEELEGEYEAEVADEAGC